MLGHEGSTKIHGCRTDITAELKVDMKSAKLYHGHDN